MLDFTNSPETAGSDLIDAIYAAIVDRNDPVGALHAICDMVGAGSAILTSSERGQETPLAAFGERGGDGSQGLRFDGRVTEGGRRLVLHLGFASAPVRDRIPFGLMAHLDRAIGLSMRLGCADLERDLGSELLDRLSVGTIYLDAERQVVGMTGMARALVEDGGILRLRGALLRVADGGEDRALQDAIRVAVGDPSAGPAEIVRVRHPLSDRALGIVVQPIASAARRTGIACALVIRDSERPAAPGQEMLRDLFDLTPAEANLTSILSTGLTLDEAAADLAISRNTARAHLRAIFSKCGINRQTELVRLVLSSVAMLGGQTGTAHAA